jgi:peroxiredoxin
MEKPGKMKHIVPALLLLLMPFTLAYGQSGAGHAIGVQLKNYHNGKLYLGNFFGKQTYVVDSASMDARGTAVFKGTDTLPGGIYFVLLPAKKRYFEMLIDKGQRFSVTADTANDFRNLTFSGSPDNTLFNGYNAFLRKEQQQVREAKKAGKDSVAIKALQEKVSKDIADYRIRFRKDHPGGMLAMIFKAMEDPIVPPQPESTKKTDSTYKFRYFKKHYWDNIDFSDNRILYTPVLETRLHRYFSQMVVPAPDSVNEAADAMLDRVSGNKEMFKYVLWWLTNTYANSPYMGLDAVYVHLVEKYYMTGKAFWLTKEQTKKIITRASQIAPNLIGNTAPDLALKTPDLKSVSLSGVKAKYTILVFWDPTCGHCQIVVPELDSAYEHHWKKEGVKMMGVLAGGTQQQWLDFIKKNNMQDWINVWDPDKATNYRRLYDVYMTPVVYLLGEDKKILAKKLDVKQLDDFLNHLQKKKDKMASAGQ